MSPFSMFFQSLIPTFNIEERLRQANQPPQQQQPQVQLPQPQQQLQQPQQLNANEGAGANVANPELGEGNLFYIVHSFIFK